MPWCPNCKEEYREGFFKCSDCGATLVDKLPQADSIQSDNNSDQRETDSNILIEPCLLLSVSDGIQAKLIEGLLQNSNIPFYTKDRECGGYLKIYMGFSVFGTDIYVDKNSYDKAKELMDTAPAQFSTDYENDTEYEPLDDKDNRSFTVRKTVMRIVIFLILIPFVLSLIFGAFSIIHHFIGR